MSIKLSGVYLVPSQVLSDKSGNNAVTKTKTVAIVAPQRSNSLDYLNFEEKRQIIASSLSLSDFLHVGNNATKEIKDGVATVIVGCYGLGVIEPALYKSTLNLDELQWPEGHIGRIWFSLRYEPSTEKLLVSLLKAKNLPSRSIGTVNSCDPFVRLHLMPDERRFLQSKQKKKTCNPYFDETLVFQVSAKDMTDHTLKLTVIDAGRTKRKSEIGHVTFQLKDLEVGDGTEQQLFKFDLEKEIQEQKSDLGEVLVALVYNEHLNRLTATVIEARRLKEEEEDINSFEECYGEVLRTVSEGDVTA
ncbi:synaptotagmin-15-like [Photinus pyralis]|uniref:synaptotagmin-15-like n=1 Tax=Photinus pyralis TaxID=7054 RepID=UPI001267811F|nr:synaptotagmin-15-like [Photinus pyralis]